MFASTRIHFISFQGFYREYRAVQGLINDRGHLFRRDTHFILLNVFFLLLNYTFSVENGEFSYLRSSKKKKKKKKIPTQIFCHFTVGRGGQTNIFFFWPNYCFLSHILYFLMTSSTTVGIFWQNFAQILWELVITEDFIDKVEMSK